MPDPIDRYVGARVRLRRKALDLSQADLAHGLGLTFQQIQKYERGANRISASKLYGLAVLLRVEPGWFFEGLPPTQTGESGDLVEIESRRAAQALIATPDGLALAHFLSVMPSNRRRHILAVMAALADTERERQVA